MQENILENRYYKKRRKKKKKKKKKSDGLGWGNPIHYGTAPAGETAGFSGGDGGGMGESKLRSVIRSLIILEKKSKESPVQEMLKKYGIEKPMKTSSSHSANSIGKSIKDGKWYGYSHRAVFGFGIGDKIFEKDFGDKDTKFDKHGSKTIKTDADAKKAASNFARYVS